MPETKTDPSVTPASPLPWRLIALSTHNAVWAANHCRIARLYRAAVNPDHEQDARYIVHACNLHPELVAALKEIAAAAATPIGQPESMLRALMRADAVLAKCAAQGSQE